MKSFLLSVGVAITITLFYFELTNGAVAEKSCKMIAGDLTRRQLNGISTCTKTMKFKNGRDKAKKMNCLLKCVLKNEKILDDEGLFSKGQVDSLLVREFPPSLIDRANATFTPCADLAEGKLDPNPETDEFCQTYDPFIKCLLGAMQNLCPK